MVDEYPFILQSTISVIYLSIFKATGKISSMVSNLRIVMHEEISLVNPNLKPMIVAHIFSLMIKVEDQ